MNTWTGDTLALDIQNPDFARVPRLVLSIDNGPYLNFTGAMRALKDSQTQYSVTIPGVIDGRVRAAFDRDAGMSWCWRGRNATLDLRIDDMTIGLSAPRGHALGIRASLQLPRSST